MKYKVLLTGNSKMIINEFFTYMDFSFDCMYTSDRYDDIMNHIKYIKPDIFVYCLDNEKPDDLKRFVNVESKLRIYKIPLVVIGDSDECDQFTKITLISDVTEFQKPISHQNVESAIKNMLDEKNGVIKKMPNDTKLDTTNLDEKTDEMLHEFENILSSNDIKKKFHVNKKKHILIVDDDSSVLKLIKGYLADRYNVATAISGKVALKFLETKGTDLVLLDYEMPGEDGLAVLNAIRANEKTKDLPVVFLTGVTDKEKIQEVLKMKVQGYLLKPIDMSKLSSTIKGIFG